MSKAVENSSATKGAIDDFAPRSSALTVGVPNTAQNSAISNLIRRLLKETLRSWQIRMCKFADGIFLLSRAGILRSKVTSKDLVLLARLVDVWSSPAYIARGTLLSPNI